MSSPVAERFAELLEHRRIDGDDTNNAIVDAIGAALGDVFEPLGLIGYGDEDAGFGPVQVLRDPTVATRDTLAHAALYTGATPLPGRRVGESDDDYLARARDAAVYPLGIKRGTVEAVKRAAQPLLTGTKSVVVAGVPGNPYQLYVRTRAAETPDPAAVRHAIEGDYVSGGARGTMRAELELLYFSSDSAAWLEATLSWSAAAGVTWDTATLEAVT